MRLAFVLLLAPLAGCPIEGTGDCQLDSECGDLVCARDGICMTADSVRAVKATWTINGVAANAESCASAPDLYIRFNGATRDDSLGFSPVPCFTGQFTIDKLPKRFVSVQLGVDGGTREVVDIDDSGMAIIDLPLF